MSGSETLKEALGEMSQRRGGEDPWIIGCIPGDQPLWIGGGASSTPDPSPSTPLLGSVANGHSSTQTEVRSSRPSSDGPRMPWHLVVVCSCHGVRCCSFNGDGHHHDHNRDHNHDNDHNHDRESKADGMDCAAIELGAWIVLVSSVSSGFVTRPALGLSVIVA